MPPLISYRMKDKASRPGPAIVSRLVVAGAWPSLGLSRVSGHPRHTNPDSEFLGQSGQL